VDAMDGLGRKGAISESFLADRLEGSVEPRSEPFTRVCAKARQDGVSASQTKPMQDPQGGESNGSRSSQAQRPRSGAGHRAR
jgi:hypothetical protein